MSKNGGGSSSSKRIAAECHAGYASQSSDLQAHFAETGRAPSASIVARLIGSDTESVRQGYARLRAQRVLVLQSDGESIRMAPLFSGVATQHVASVTSKRYFANCAWDAIGIPAALHRPAVVYSRCEQSGEPLRLQVSL
jgi:Alkylmercury lyase